MKGKIMYYSIALAIFIILWNITAHLVNYLPISPIVNILSILFIVVIIFPLSLLFAKKIIEIIKNMSL